MKIALFANGQKPQALEVLKDLSHFLQGYNVTVLLEHSDVFSDKELPKIIRTVSTCDFITSIGGDGSILHLIHKIGIPKIPIVGINLGSLGFLSDINVTNLFSDFESICKGAYHTRKRLILDGCICDQRTGFAVNEIAVHRGCYPGLIDLAIHVDGTFVNTFSADGIIVCTPSGSTAYSLAAGGPIVYPDLPAFILTPICPHTMSNRPIVLMPKESITIELWRGAQTIDVAFDGQPPLTLSRNECLEIRKSDTYFQLVNMPRSDFFSTVRTKLGWTGSLRLQ